MEKHFCTCNDTNCAKHPINHSHGCDPCVKGNLRNKDIPRCFFKAVHDDISELKNFTMETFVDFFNKHRG